MVNHVECLSESVGHDFSRSRYHLCSVLNYLQEVILRLFSPLVCVTLFSARLLCRYTLLTSLSLKLNWRDF